MEQSITNRISLNFNLREPKGNKQTIVYAIIRFGNQQFKVPTGCKCNSWHWDKKQQIPDFTKEMSVKERELNMRTYEILTKIRFAFLNFFIYLCTIDENNRKKELIEHLHIIIRKCNGMANNENLRKSVIRTPKATTLLKKAFEIYFSEVRKAKASTMQTQKSHLNSFVSYCQKTGKDKISMLSQKGLNDYKNYLMKVQKESKANEKKRYANNTAINAKCEIIERLINKVISSHNDFLKYKIEAVIYQKLVEEKVKGEDKARRPLTPKELEQLNLCTDLSSEEIEYRDLFILECYCAYRIGDTAKLFNKSLHKVYKKGDLELIMIETQKENIDAVIWITEEVKKILDKYENGFKHVKELGSKEYRDKFNRMIKK